MAAGVPMMQTMYASSEGFIGVHLGPKFLSKASYVLCPSLTIIEFIRLEDR